MLVCGLDFGTSNTAVALPSGEVLRLDLTAPSPRLFRSVLFFPEDSKETLAGHAAIERYQEDNAGRFIQSMKTWLPATTFTRTQLRGRTLSLEELIAVFLRRVRALAGESAGEDVTSVVLGRPARFSADPKIDAFAEERLRKAAEVSGFTSIRFVIEPIAAALTYEATLEKDEAVLVADFGAGTTDLTVMHLGPSRRGRADRREDVVASSGVYVGGDRFDSVITAASSSRAARPAHGLLVSFDGLVNRAERLSVARHDEGCRQRSFQKRAVNSTAPASPSVGFHCSRRPEVVPCRS